MSARRLAGAGLIALLSPVVACSDDDGVTDSAASSTTASSTSTTAAPEPLVIVVTNDDGIGADGIDVLVEHLRDVPGAEVHVVAPAEDNSGSSDKTTAGGVTYDEAETASGTEGVAVDGFPADTIAVALDELGLEPDLVVAGINIGQNIAAFVPVSGTIGAARTAARRGIPALAVSGELQDPDYETAAGLAVEWIAEHRDDLGPAANTDRTVASINVPTCAPGTEVRGVVAVPVAVAVPEGINALEIDADCASTVTDPSDDLAAMLVGFASESEIPADL